MSPVSEPAPDPSLPATLRRVLVALDASPASVAAARAAVELAMGSGAEVVGLFVEDRELLAMAGFPWSATWGPDQPAASEWSAETVERRLGSAAARARGSLEEAAGQRGLSVQFLVVRGDVTEEILRRLPEADVLVLGRVGWSGGRTRRLGRTAAAVLARSRGVLLPHGSSGKAVLRLLLR